MTEVDFVMAEHPEENERLFASWDHSRLVSNNVAAANLIQGRLARLERSVDDYENCLKRAQEILNSSAKLGRTNRRRRDEAVTAVEKMIAQLLLQADPSSDLPDERRQVR